MSKLDRCIDCGKEYKFDYSEINPNIDPSNDIQFTNRSVSRRHCMIETIDKYTYIVDLDSKFGTYLNDIKLIPRERVLLSDNDEISIGKGIEVVKIRYMK